MDTHLPTKGQICLARAEKGGGSFEEKKIKGTEGKKEKSGKGREKRKKKRLF